jgi:hypothetical protein
MAPPHTVVAYGTAEPFPFDVQSPDMAAALLNGEYSVDLLPLEGLNHQGSVNSLGDPDGKVFQATARLMGI